MCDFGLTLAIERVSTYEKDFHAMFNLNEVPSSYKLFVNFGKKINFKKVVMHLQSPGGGADFMIGEYIMNFVKKNTRGEFQFAVIDLQFDDGDEPMCFPWLLRKKGVANKDVNAVKAAFEEMFFKFDEDSKIPRNYTLKTRLGVPAP
jgi:hypothetical protein